MSVPHVATLLRKTDKVNFPSIPGCVNPAALLPAKVASRDVLNGL